jgi:hypothetical protein
MTRGGADHVSARFAWTFGFVSISLGAATIAGGVYRLIRHSLGYPPSVLSNEAIDTVAAIGWLAMVTLWAVAAEDRRAEATDPDRSRGSAK